MQRFFALIAVIVFSVPVGISIAGCGGTNPNNYCVKNGHGYGEKVTDLDHIILGPATTGISLSYGQIGQVNSPTGYNCNGGTVSVAHYVYGSTNLNLVDINPSTGQLCAGTWNRHSPSGIPDFTICTPATQPGVAQVTASASAVTSNPVYVYVHPPISAITIGSQTSCVSQNNTLAEPLTSSTVVYDSEGNPINSSYVGTVTYTPVDSTIVSITNISDTSAAGTVNGVATAHLPGSTVINATLSSVTSAAGYFFTCPPKNISLALNGSTGYPTPVSVSASSVPTLSTTITDTTGATIGGLSLDFASTQPKDISVSSGGGITPSYPATATVTAICQPGTCNPAPINIIGQLGTGLPVTSNPVFVKTPGRSSSKLWLASSQSQYFTPVDLVATGTPAPVKLPYIPNSMVLDQNGQNLYFGSYHELMIVSATTSSLTKEDPNVPGVVLAVSPDSSTVVINDQINQIIYLYKYSSSGSSFTSTQGLATKAKYSPDGKNLYLVGPNNLYIYNTQTGWHTYTLSSGQGGNCNLNNNNGSGSYDPFCSPDVAVTVPSVGFYMTGVSATTARSFCYNKNTTDGQAPYYPPADNVAAATDHLASTYNGSHVLGAAASTGQITDIQFPASGSASVPPGPPTGACPDATTGAPLKFNTTWMQAALGITPTEITGIVPSQDSSLAFVTYTASNGSGILPAYEIPSTPGSAGTVQKIQLASGAQAPIAGAFSPDGSTFFVSTSGDNLVHFVDTSTSSPADTGQTINPQLPSCTRTNLCSSTTYVPAQFIAVQPRPTT
ncbi:MAG: hypothetical protein IRZ03_03595 [Acidobacterium ailaaui]|nr:hypothetical protein [Pseudacidobacterium ailaaui]MCL6463942.1 hypothetical protein [Pseudacidobacterium ailaaui]